MSSSDRPAGATDENSSGFAPAAHIMTGIDQEAGAGDRVENGVVVEVHGEGPTQVDIKQLARFEREQKDKLKILHARIERLRNQEQKCWKDISRTQKQAEVNELGEAVRATSAVIAEQVHEDLIHNFEEKRQKVAEVRADLAANKGAHKELLLEEARQVGEIVRDQKQRDEEELRFFKEQQVEDKRERALVVQSHREIQRERREIEKHLIEEDRRREKEKRYHSVLQDVESLNSEIEEAERLEMEALEKLQHSQRMRDQFLHQSRHSIADGRAPPLSARIHSARSARGSGATFGAAPSSSSSSIRTKPRGLPRAPDSGSLSASSSKRSMNASLLSNQSSVRSVSNSHAGAGTSNRANIAGFSPSASSAAHQAWQRRHSGAGSSVVVPKLSGLEHVSSTPKRRVTAKHGLVSTPSSATPVGGGNNRSSFHQTPTSSSAKKSFRPAPRAGHRTTSTSSGPSTARTIADKYRAHLLTSSNSTSLSSHLQSQRAPAQLAEHRPPRLSSTGASSSRGQGERAPTAVSISNTSSHDVVPTASTTKPNEQAGGSSSSGESSTTAATGGVLFSSSDSALTSTHRKSETTMRGIVSAGGNNLNFEQVPLFYSTTSAGNLGSNSKSSSGSGRSKNSSDHLQASFVSSVSKVTSLGDAERGESNGVGVGPAAYSSPVTPTQVMVVDGKLETVREVATPGEESASCSMVERTKVAGSAAGALSSLTAFLGGGTVKPSSSLSVQSAPSGNQPRGAGAGNKPTTHFAGSCFSQRNNSVVSEGNSPKNRGAGAGPLAPTSHMNDVVKAFTSGKPIGRMVKMAGTSSRPSSTASTPLGGASPVDQQNIVVGVVAPNAINAAPVVLVKTSPTDECAQPQELSSSHPGAGVAGLSSNSGAPSPVTAPSCWDFFGSSSSRGGGGAAHQGHLVNSLRPVLQSTQMYRQLGQQPPGFAAPPEPKTVDAHFSPKQQQQHQQEFQQQRVHLAVGEHAAANLDHSKRSALSASGGITLGSMEGEESMLSASLRSMNYAGKTWMCNDSEDEDESPEDGP